VVTGQQAGVLTGPLYTIYKAAAAVKLARELTRQGMKAVPVFWIPSEDHDFQEIRSVLVQGKEGLPVKIEVADKSSGQPVERIPFSKEEGERLIQELDRETPATEFKGEILETLRDTARRSETFTRWFALLMTRLFKGTGLILFNPLIPEIRKGAGGLLASLGLQGEKIQGLLSTREKELEERGYHVQVNREKEHLNLFAFLPGGRAALLNQDGQVVTRQGNNLGEIEEVAKKIENNPGEFGPGVLTRPLMQETLLPTLSYVAGPAELSYFAQLMPLYEHFHLRPPVLYPRPSLTLVEPRMRRFMEKYSLSREDLFDLEQVRQNYLEEKGSRELKELFQGVERNIRKEYDALGQELIKIEKGLGDLTQKNLGRVMKEVDYLKKKAREALKDKNEKALSHFKILEESVLPGGELQERKYNIFPYLIKYGPGFMDKLKKEFPLEPGHHFFEVV
ncbi:MAG: bacillithiol biosynthesis cysteine-adding enzyme BshC, partial [Candidatus Syntrophonatronum acetioxidans]